MEFFFSTSWFEMTIFVRFWSGFNLTSNRIFGDITFAGPYASLFIKWIIRLQNINHDFQIIDFSSMLWYKRAFYSFVKKEIEFRQTYTFCCIIDINEKKKFPALGIHDFSFPHPTDCFQEVGQCFGHSFIIQCTVPAEKLPMLMKLN